MLAIRVREIECCVDRKKGKSAGEQMKKYFAMLLEVDIHIEEDRLLSRGAECTESAE